MLRSARDRRGRSWVTTPRLAPGRPCTGRHDGGSATRLTAGSLVAALDTVDRTAEARLQEGDGALPPAEVEHLLDLAVAFVTAGIEGVSDPRRR